MSRCFPKRSGACIRDGPYPQSYSDREREQFHHFATLAEEKIRHNRFTPFRNDPTINSLIDRYFLDGLRDFSGVMCSAGRDFVTIAADGNIYMCGTTGRIGNIFQRRLTLSKTEQPCRGDWCHYACVRYSEKDGKSAQALPFTRPEETMTKRVGDLIYLAERGTVNSLVRLSLR